ncbi:MAG: hypothetical protein EPO24_04990, partial [Bacteroidetes bacterium]
MIYLLLLVSVFVLLGCNDEADVQIIPSVVDVSYEELFSGCTLRILHWNVDLVVDNQHQYDSLYPHYVFGCQKTSIDFNESVAIGFFAAVGGCREPTFEVKVQQHTTKKKIIVTYTVIEQGSCSMIVYSSYWIKMPKVKPGYSMVIER